MSLMDTYWTAEKLIVEEKTPKQIRMKANEYTRRFKSVIVRIGLEENIGWYRSNERDVDNRCYIFWGEDGDEVREQLDSLFKVIKPKKVCVSVKNIELVSSILCNLLPKIKDEQKINGLLNERLKTIREFIFLIDQTKQSEIFSSNFGINQREKKEIQQISNYLSKIDDLKIISNTRERCNIKSEYDKYEDKKKKIRDTVTDFFLDKMKDNYFEKYIFVNITECANSTKDFYIKQFLIIQRWYIKWLCIISNLNEFRQAENFYNMCEVFYHYNRRKEKEDVEKKIMEDIELYCKFKKFSMAEQKEAYDRFCRINIPLFSMYMETIFDTDTMKKLIDNISLKERLCDRVNINKVKYKVSCIDLCKDLLEDIRTFEMDKIDTTHLKQIKVYAFGELEELKKQMLDYNVMEKILNSKENVGIPEEKGIKSKFLNCYSEYNKDNKTIKKELLECVFDIKQAGNWSFWVEDSFEN